MGKLQTILIPKYSFTKREAVSWISHHGYKTTYFGKAPDSTKNYYRFRQRIPIKYKNYYSKTLPNGIRFVLYE